VSVTEFVYSSVMLYSLHTYTCMHVCSSSQFISWPETTKAFVILLSFSCGVAHKRGNVRVDLERSRRCFGRKEELGVVTRALNVCVGLVRSSRCFGRKEERCCLWRAVSSWSVVMAVKRHYRCSSQLVAGWPRVGA
jgi:hypothetical protein